MRTYRGDEIAVIGMACRFPDADTPDQFWRNILEGRESITHFTDEELEGIEYDFESVRGKPDFVKARGVLHGVDMFDAGFFGFNPREAAVLDPQQRVWLECAWEALEIAGYDSNRTPGAVGVYAGSYVNSYLLNNLCVDREYIDRLVRFRSVDAFQNIISNDKDYLPSRTAYKFNLRGPAVNVQTACSTSLVAVCQAVQSLLHFESDMALAGGACITFPQVRGYHYQEGGMVSPDGRCRPFDARAEGTVFSSGVGVVVLKRLDEALADRDQILSVILGTALNNDGSVKVSYSAPSVEGQAAVIASAHANAGIDPRTITYVEAHGTGTPLGDPIEVAGLTKAFRSKTEDRQFCGLGSVKSNVGHLDSAAGIAGMIKTIQALRHGVLPPSLHFEQPNPQIDFESSPFYMVTERRPWATDGVPRRAGISSFGVGGTNAHVVLEEPPEAEPSGESRPWQLLLLSTKTPTALDAATENLAQHLESGTDARLADVAFTLQVGRKEMEHRRVVVCSDRSEAAANLRSRERRWVASGATVTGERSVVFMFPGQGAQHLEMARGLYETEPTFRAWIDKCAEVLEEPLRMDIRRFIVSDGGDPEETLEILTQTAVTQPVLFSVEYALARLWMSWGVQPDAMIGHSLGDFVAACLAEVFTLEETLNLLAVRGRLMQEQPPGSMLAVMAGLAAVETHLGGDLSLAALNGPSLCVLSGPDEAIEEAERALTGAGLEARILRTSHAFHSSMMEPAVAPFVEAVAKANPRPPARPFVSSLTGRWITSEEATDPTFWGRQLREPVRFSDGIQELAKAPGRVFLEVGPNRTLSTLAQQHKTPDTDFAVIASLRHVNEELADLASLLKAVGALWIAGVTPDWSSFHADEVRQRVSLPTYPFERKRHWVDAPAPVGAGTSGVSLPAADVPALSSPTAASVPSVQPAPMPQIDRRAKILSKLQSILYDLSGIQVSDAEADASFIELGLDSLFLTQASAEFENQFGVKVTFRELLEDITSLSLLANHLDARLPADAFAEPDTPPPAPAPAGAPPLPTSAAFPPAAAGTGGAASELERVIQSQLSVMAAQLEALRGGGVAAATPTAGATALPAGASGDSASADIHGGLRLPRVEAKKGPGAAAASRFGPYKSIERARDGTLTERQQAHLAELIKSFTEKTAASKRMAAQTRPDVADPRSISGFRRIWKELVYQIVADRSQGAHLWDVDGNEYVDITMGFGVNFLGHSPEFVTEAVRAQLDKGVEIGPQSPLTGEVAAMIKEFTGMDRVSFCNTGSEAVMAAMRVARTVTGRWRIAYFSGDYHGLFDEVLARGQVVDNVLQTVPAAPGVPKRTVEGNLVLDYGTDDSLRIIEEFADELAAVVVEPIQSRYPEVRPREFLEKLRDLTRERDIALVFDEVITGFRVHPGGAQAWYGVQADLASYGKVVGGGIPIGVLAGRHRFMEVLDGGLWNFGDDSVPEADVTFFAGTFVRHPLALAAAKAVMEHLKEEGPELQERTTRMTADFVAEMNRFFEERMVPIRLRSFSSWFRFDYPGDLTFAQLLFYHLVLRGVYIREAGQNCFFSTTHTPADVDRVMQAIRESVIALQDAGFLPELGPEVVDQLPEVVRFPLTSAQQEVWVSSQLGDGASCAYNESVSLEFDGQFDLDAMRRALRSVVARHSALRARFSEDGDYQEIVSSLELEVPFEDWSDRDEHDHETLWQELVAEDAGVPFDLVGGPLIRATVVRVGPAHHRLLLTAHHLVMDGWSSNVVVGDLRLLYNEATEGTPRDLPEPLQYQEYANWLVQQQTTEEYARGEAYWLEQYAQPASSLELPSDRPRRPMEQFASRTIRRTISGEVTKTVRRLGASRGSTLFATLLAIYGAWLRRLSGKDDVVVGVPASGQSLVGDDNLVGHCVHFLPIRIKVEGDPSFSEFLDRVKQVAFSASEFQNFTYGRLLEKIAVDRSGGGRPLIEAHFNLEKLHHPALGEEGSFSGLEFEADENPKRFTVSEVFFNFLETRDGMVLDCRYNSDLFDEATIEAWLDAFEAMVDGVVTNPEARVSAVPLLSDAHQRAAILGDPSSVEIPSSPLHQLISATARDRGRATAVGCAGEEVSYEEIEARANRLAHHLGGMGVGPGTLVGVCLHRSADMVSTLLGIWKTGAAYLPLDADFPADRIAFMLEDAVPAVVVAHGDLLAELPIPATTRVVDLSAEGDMEAGPGGAPDVTVGPDDIAYVIYTSGSTGRPKGVVVSHGAVTNFMVSMADRPGLGKEDCLLAVTTLSFDIAALELFLPLLVGGRVEVADEASLEDLPSLVSWMEGVGVTALQATPTFWRLLMDAGWKGRSGFKALSGGEALPRDVADELIARCGGIWNMYGPTETTIWSSCGFLDLPQTPIDIGRPIDNTTLAVLDPNGALVPVGVPGELFIGGTGVAQGYLHRPELTADRFLPDPWGVSPAARMYRTGDRVRRRGSGELEFLGRIDQQVKLRGFRIELGEVEYALTQARGVRSAAASVQEVAAGDRRLVGYVVLEQGAEFDRGEITDVLRRILPPYMLPQHLVALEELPTTPNGKLDRTHLPAPALSESSPLSDAGPLTPLEEDIVKVWADVLKVESIRQDSDFFELGGHSVLATQVVSRLRKSKRVPLTLRHFFEAPTPSALARTVERLDSANDRASEETREKVVF